MRKTIVAITLSLAFLIDVCLSSRLKGSSSVTYVLALETNDESKRGEVFAWPQEKEECGCRALRRGPTGLSDLSTCRVAQIVHERSGPGVQLKR